MVKTVAQYMSAEPVCVEAQSPVKTAVKLMAEHRVSGLPVQDEAGKLVGVISESDLMWQASGVTPPAYIQLLDSVLYLKNPATYERDLHKAFGQTVAEVMTGKAITVAADESLSNAAQAMNQHKIHRLMVVDQDQTLIGLLSRGDIIRAMAEEL